MNSVLLTLISEANQYYRTTANVSRTLQEGCFCNVRTVVEPGKYLAEHFKC